MRSQTNAVWNTLITFDLQAEDCYWSWRSLQQVLVHAALKARQHQARGHWALASGPQAGCRGAALAACWCQLPAGCRLPLAALACLPQGRSPLGSLGHNVTKPDVHREPPRPLLWARSLGSSSASQAAGESTASRHRCWTWRGGLSTTQAPRVSAPCPAPQPDLADREVRQQRSTLVRVSV